MVTITVEQLAVAVRLSTDPTAAVVEPDLGILTRQLAVATAYVNHRAPDVPVETGNEAVVLIAGWLYDSAPSGRRTVQAAYSHSGAAGLLSPYISRRAEAV